MDKRPPLTKTLSADTFLNYYYLKEELVAFCRQYNLPVSGSKIDITKRIAHYLETGEILKTKIKSRPQVIISNITEETQIEPNFICSEIHRAFFKEKIGPSFTFPVAFQKWLKTNTGKTYKEAIAAYYQILDDKKKGRTQIDKQFEYNTYIRDFFDHNPGKSLDQAIACWKYKKSLPGHNRYEESDLIALKEKHL